MDISRLAKEHIESALSKGTIQLFKDGHLEERVVATATILAISKDILKQGLGGETSSSDSFNLPTEMLANGKSA